MIVEDEMHAFVIDMKNYLKLSNDMLLETKFSLKTTWLGSNANINHVNLNIELLKKKKKKSEKIKR